MFSAKYKLNKERGSEPKFRKVAKRSPWNVMDAGLYNEGLITIFDLGYNDSFLSSWNWLIGDNIILIGCTCWGDFFYVDLNNGEFYIVLLDQFKKFQLGNSFAAVFDMNLADENFQKEILRPNDFLSFKEEAGILDYGECYIKDRQTGIKEKRDLSLILDVIGQKGQQF